VKDRHSAKAELTGWRHEHPGQKHQLLSMVAAAEQDPLQPSRGKGKRSVRLEETLIPHYRPRINRTYMAI
jgi:hypothetical protein